MIQKILNKREQVEGYDSTWSEVDNLLMLDPKEKIGLSDHIG